MDLAFGVKSVDVFLSHWNIGDRRTFVDRLKVTINLIDDVLPDLDVNDRKEQWPHRNPSCIIDCFKVRTLQPAVEPWQYYFLKGEGYGVKFEIVCSMGCPRIIYCSGPWRGAARDDTIAKYSEAKRFLEKGERLLANKIYRADTETFICPLPGTRSQLTDAENLRNYSIYSARQSVERLIKRDRNFAVIGATAR